MTTPNPAALGVTSCLQQFLGVHIGVLVVGGGFLDRRNTGRFQQFVIVRRFAHTVKAELPRSQRLHDEHLELVLLGAGVVDVDADEAALLLGVGGRVGQGDIGGVHLGPVLADVDGVRGAGGMPLAAQLVGGDEGVVAFDG